MTALRLLYDCDPDADDAVAMPLTDGYLVVVHKDRSLSQRPKARKTAYTGGVHSDSKHDN